MKAVKVNENNIAIEVIVGNAAWAQKAFGGIWLNTSNKVGVGWEWVESYGFRPPRPYPSWIWSDGKWNPPTPYPNEGNHMWDEDTLSWIPLEATDESNS